MHDTRTTNRILIMSVRGLRNNNPGNIRKNSERWMHEIIPSQDSAFKQFDSMEWGVRALFHLLNNFRLLYGLDTIEKMIGRYAPPNENNTEAYIKSVSEWSNVSRSSSLTTTNRDVMVPIVEAMIRVETGIRSAVPREVIDKGWKLFLENKRGK